MGCIDHSVVQVIGRVHDQYQGGNGAARLDRVVAQVRIVTMTADRRHVVDRAGRRRLNLQGHRHTLTWLEHTNVPDHRARDLHKRDWPLDGQHTVDVPADVGQSSPVQGGRVPQSTPERQ